MKTFCNKCIARDIKLSSFLRGNPRELLIFTFSLLFLNFCVIEDLVVVLFKILFNDFFFQDNEL